MILPDLSGQSQIDRNTSKRRFISGHIIDKNPLPLALQFNFAPEAAARARSAVLIQDAFVSRRNSANTVIAGQLASAEPPHTGPITIACVDGEVLSVHCSQVEHFATLLSETPNFGLLVPKLDVELNALAWLWQD